MISRNGLVATPPNGFATKGFLICQTGAWSRVFEPPEDTRWGLAALDPRHPVALKPLLLIRDSARVPAVAVQEVFLAVACRFARRVVPHRMKRKRLDGVRQRRV